MSKKSYFRELSQKEKESKLKQLEFKNENVKIWKKNQKERYTFKVARFDNQSMKLHFFESDVKVPDKDILYGFEINGLSYFGKGVFQENEMYSFINCDGQLFKAERREAFRLLTYPMFEMYADIPISAPERSKDNVINLKSGMSETGLFKNFLKLINTENKSSENTLALRVLDLSVGGVAIRVGDIEKDLLPVGVNIGPIVIRSLNDTFKIEKAKIVHIAEEITGSKLAKSFKLGVQFIDLPSAIEQKIAVKINAALKGEELEFEDFIK